MDEVIIRAQELNKTFSLKRGKRVEALKDLDLTVKKGELTAIIGPDGAGKTTFMRLIAGLMDPTKGKLCIGAGQRQRGANNPAPHFLYATKIWPL